MRKRVFSTKNIALISLFTAALSLCSLVTVPFTIPFTLQTFGVFLAVFSLGLKKGIISVITYILLGCTGLPVFSSFQGGLQAIFSLNGGFIIGFVAMSLCIGFLVKKLGSKRVNLILAGISGLIVLYLCEFLWLIFVYSFEATTALTFIIVYFPFDIIKLVLAVFLSEKIKKFIRG